MTLEELQRELDARDDGVLKHGKHEPGREFCALEFEGQVRGREWSDAPITLPDLRPLNDARWSSDQARTQALLPVMVALWDWSDWSPAQQRAWASRVAILTVNRIIANIPRLPDAVRTQCAVATSLEEAKAAAYAAYAADATYVASHAESSAAAYVADAARAAADAVAHAVAYVAAYAADAAHAALAASAAADSVDAVLQTACAIWIEAAQEVQ